MDDMKSAREIAMEKVAKLDEATEEERLKWKYFPEGERLAVRYLKEDCNLLAELTNYEEKAKKYVVAGAAEILTRNIGLPKSERARKSNKRGMDGLKMLKQDKASVENVYSRMRRVFDHYLGQGEQQRKQAYQSLKVEFEARVRQAMQQQLSPVAGMKIDVERQPEFQEEWRRVLARLESQYDKLMDEFKQDLLAIA